MVFIRKYSIFFLQAVQVGEMALQLRVLVLLTEDWNSIPSTHLPPNIIICMIDVLQGIDVLFWSPQAAQQVCIHTDTNDGGLRKGLWLKVIAGFVCLFCTEPKACAF